jgi:hypothetical protein
MTTHLDGLLFNADDIRSIVIRARRLGLRRERVFAALTRPLLTRPLDDPVTGMVVRRIFDEEWPRDNAWPDRRAGIERMGVGVRDLIRGSAVVITRHPRGRMTGDLAFSGAGCQGWWATAAAACGPDPSID